VFPVPLRYRYPGPFEHLQRPQDPDPVRDVGEDDVGRCDRVELVVRVVDARGKLVAGARKYFYLFEDETGVLEGVGDRPCLTIGEPPVCCLRGEPRTDGNGIVKMYECAFQKSF